MRAGVVSVLLTTIIPVPHISYYLVIQFLFSQSVSRCDLSTYYVPEMKIYVFALIELTAL